MERLEWADSQGDRFLVERSPIISREGRPIVCSIMVSDSDDGEEAAVWLTRENAEDLRDWLNELIVRG